MMTTIYKVGSGDNKKKVLTDLATGERHVVDFTRDPLDSESVWTTRDGTVMQIADMDDRHIENTIAMLRRGAFMLHWKYVMDFGAMLSGPLGPQGDMASMIAEQEFDALATEDPAEWIEEVPVVRAMKDELIRRHEP